MFPPMEGGLPGHTDRLAHALSTTFAVTVLTSPGTETQRPFPVIPQVARWQDGPGLLAAIRRVAPTGPLLWQYVPHMYGRGGVNLALPGVVRALHREGRRQVVIAHEIRAPFSGWPHRTAYALAHRWMWRRIRHDADALGISTAGWLDQLRRDGAPADRLFLAPSPANIPVAVVTADHAERWRAAHDLAGARAVLGFFGSPGSGKQFDWVLDAWRAARRREPATALVVVGGRPAAPPGADEARWFRALGYLEAGPASAALQALDLLALPFVDGVSERRSSFMTALAHGLPVVTTHGPATGGTLRTGDFLAGTPVEPGAFATAVADLAGDASRRLRMGARARAVYAQQYDWPVLAATLGARLTSG